MKREFKELQARYQNSEESNKMLLKQNEGYRNVIVKNEEVLSKQTTELKELQVRMEVQRTNNERQREEKDLLLKQNEKLIAEMKNATSDQAIKALLDRMNRSATGQAAGSQLNPEQMKEKLKNT